MPDRHPATPVDTRFPLETERLLIRPFEPSDAEAIFETWGDPEAMRWIPGGAHPDVEASRQRIGRFTEHQAAHGFSLWPVIEKASGRILGDCGLILVQWTGPEVELAYRFGRRAWGKGYATEAAGVCLRYGFDVAGLDTIIAVTHPDHVASRRVMEKNGMRFVGMVQYYGRDLVKYAKTKAESDAEPHGQAVVP
jgi:ribosomal-protein-alanine N-acetyltransferase